MVDHVHGPRFRLPDGICGPANTYGHVGNVNQAAFTMPRDSPFHNVSVPGGDATMVEHYVPRLNGRRLTTVFPGYTCRARRFSPPDRQKTLAGHGHVWHGLLCNGNAFNSTRVGARRPTRDTQTEKLTR